jgi:hypothetical protein
MSAPQNIQLGAVRCVRAQVLFQWTGAWVAHVDVDPDGVVTASSVPSGAQTLTIGQSVTLQGTVNAEQAARWVAGVQLELVAGGGGWASVVPAQDFQSPGGVSAVSVENATASLIGEKVNDPQPVSLGLRWERLNGPASRIFRNPDRSWYVDPSGITQVGTWPTAQPDPSVEVLSYDPIRQIAVCSADALILPGTVLTDTSSTPRWDGPLTVRDVEMTWDAKGTRATCWFSTVAAPRVAGVLQQMVQELAGVASLKRWVYTVVSVSGTGLATTLNLQATANPDGSASDAPPLANCPMWPGLAGLSCSPALSSHVAVVFLSPGWSDPVVVHFDNTLPTMAALDATGTVNVAASAALMSLLSGAAGQGIARQGDTVIIPLAGPFPFSGTMTPPGSAIVGAITFTGALVGQISTGSAKGTCG